MLVIQAGLRRLARDLGELPSLAIVGIGVMALAATLGMLLYLAAGTLPGHLHSGFAPERGAHLIGVIGMVLTLAGVLIERARRPIRRSSAKTGGLETHAHR
jgi:hypothetical protein